MLHHEEQTRYPPRYPDRIKQNPVSFAVMQKVEKVVVKTYVKKNSTRVSLPEQRSTLYYSNRICLTKSSVYKRTITFIKKMTCVNTGLLKNFTTRTESQEFQ